MNQQLGGLGTPLLLALSQGNQAAVSALRCSNLLRRNLEGQTYLHMLATDTNYTDALYSLDYGAFFVSWLTNDRRAELTEQLLSWLDNDQVSQDDLIATFEKCGCCMRLLHG